MDKSKSFSLKKTFVLLFKTIKWISFPIIIVIGSSIALSAPMSPSPQNTSITKKWSHKMVAGVLMQLRDAAKRQGKYKLLALLNKTRISVPNKSLVKHSPNAYAYPGENNKKWIMIEERWMKQVAGFSELSALFAIAEANWGFKKQFHDFYRDYCRRFQNEYRVRSSTNRSLIYQFRIGDYYSRTDNVNSGVYATFDKVSGVTFVNTIVWTVLHEMGHHALKHTEKDEHRNSVRRKDELAADSWAFKRMQELGYSLYPVGAFFLGRDWSENCFRDLGLVGEEADRTHPFWYNRGTPLFENFDWRKAANQLSRIYFVPLGLTNGESTYYVFSISAQSRNTPQATIIQFGRTIPAIVEWKNNEVFIYVRDADRGRYEYTFKNPLNAMVSVEERHYNAQNKLVGKVDLEAIQQDTATFDFITTNGIRFGDIRARAESGDSWKRHLRTLGVSEASSVKARARRDRYTDVKNQLDTKYMKGGPSIANYEQRLTKIVNQYEADLIKILGADSYQRLHDAVTGEVNSYAPFLLELDQKWEEKLFKENFKQ